MANNTLITTKELQIGDIILSTTGDKDSKIIKAVTASQFSALRRVCSRIRQKGGKYKSY